SGARAGPPHAPSPAPVQPDPVGRTHAWGSAPARPPHPFPRDGYVLLLALLSIFIGGTLVLLSGILIICPSDDPEKTNTTYLDDSQQAQDITGKAEDPECLSSSSYRDAESERFLSSSSSTARRVSFNEAALFDQGKKTQEKGRRYTLTEGDFHHLKNARLTHLHLPPPALKIVTIHECESSENSLAMTPRLPPPKPGLAIFQVSPQCLTPGRQEVLSWGAGAPPCPQPRFFTRLRRHASLDGASPYFRIKKWKLESTQRAPALRPPGSPKRRQFQRQRAASESMDQEDRDPHQTDIIQYIAHTDDVSFHPAGGPFLPSPASPPPSLAHEAVQRPRRAVPGAGAAPDAPAPRRQRQLPPGLPVPQPPAPHRQRRRRGGSRGVRWGPSCPGAA
uniref:CACN subunit beta associated regulatory protein n=1 Tax=Serinus canaria TaxID=9135 RepID=A0A8C9MSY2_SERCA